MMKEMGWSYEDLMELPYDEYLNYSRIMSLEKKEEKKESERQQRKAKREGKM